MVEKASCMIYVHVRLKIYEIIKYTVIESRLSNKTGLFQ